MIGALHRSILDGHRFRGTAAAASALVGAWLVSVFLRTPQYNQIPDPRVVPVNGLHWLALGTAALFLSGFLLYTLHRHSGSVGDGTRSECSASAIATLRRRYASGELSEAEFERRVERLLETEGVAHSGRSISAGDGDEDEIRARPDTPSSSTIERERDR